MMARRSEPAALQLEDVRFGDDGLTALVRKSKTDQTAECAEVRVPHGVHPDPVRVVRAWLQALARHGSTSGPLLRQINRWDQLQPGGMSGAAINDRVRHLALAGGPPDAPDFTAHGLRASGPTEAAKAGHPVSFIADHGRWSKTSPQVMEYIRPADKCRDNPMRGIGLWNSSGPVWDSRPAGPLSVAPQVTSAASTRCARRWDRSTPDRFPA